MKTVEQLKGAMADLQRRRAILQQEMAVFNELQHEINSLRQRSHSNVDARRKLERLDALMKNGGQHLADQLISQASQAERCMKKISDEFQQLGALANPPACKTRRVARVRCAYI